MSRVILPTLDDPASPGGVARYIDAIQKTFPQDVEMIRVFPSQAKWEDLMGVFRCCAPRSGEKKQIWTHHIYPIATVAIRYFFETKTPYVVFLHGMDFDLARRNLWRKFLTRLILHAAKNVVVNSEALGREVRAFSGVQPLVVYPCVADELVAAANTSPAMGRQGGGVVFLSVSRLVERKGHVKVLEALKGLEGLDVRYIIVGDGPMRATIENRIKELGLSDRVEMKTSVTNDELPDIYQSADVFVMPASKTETDREGFGIVYIEAGLFGLPVIAVNQPGVDEAVLHDQTGLLIDDAPRSLSFAMKSLAENMDLRNRLGSAGKNRVMQQFTREKQMEKLRLLIAE